MSKKKTIIEMQTNESGVSFWRDKLWILDASTLLQDGEVTIDTKEFNVKTSRKYNRIYLQAKRFKPNSL